MNMESEQVADSACANTNNMQSMNGKKQVRLPFKILDPITPSPISKKRKLSDDETTCKATRTNGSKLVEKKVTPIKGSNKVVIVDENEVSSSSEPESSQEKKGCVRAGLMKFFCPVTQQQVVSTSGEVNAINEEKVCDSPMPEYTSVGTVDNTPVSSQSFPGNKQVECDEMDIECASHEKRQNGDADCAFSGGIEAITQLLEEPDTKVPAVELSVVLSGSENDSDVDQNSVIDLTLEEQDDQSALDVNLDDSANVADVSLAELNVTPAGSSLEEPVKSCASTSTIAAAENERKPASKSSIKEKERAEKQRLREISKLEKERKKQEEKDRRQSEKEKREKEKAEKKEQIEKERLEKLKVKEEEKKKKQEALDAEKLKKDDERKKKELEKQKKDCEKRKKGEEKQKEEEELTKKKEKEKAAFMSFFKKTERVDEAPCGSSANSDGGLFLAFMVKKGMVLAPARRDKLETSGFDQTYYKEGTSQNSYLDELRKGEIKPRRCAKTIQTEDRDVILLEEDAPIIMKAKFLKFCENTRPAYFGTWRKASTKLTGRNPYKKDEVLFDYEVDSDDEWEEEEPGESLSNSEGEDEGDEAINEDDDEDGFFVPHGYLSDGEGCEEDDDVTPEKMKAQQQARQRAFEVDLKKQCHRMIPIVIGICWQYAETTSLKTQRALADFECVPLVGRPVPTSLCRVNEAHEDRKDDRHRETRRRSDGRCLSVPEEAMPDLIRLLHGNVNSVKKLMREFHVYWGQKTCKAQVSSPMDTDLVTNGKRDVAADQTTPMTGEESSPLRYDMISKRQLEMKIAAIAVYKKGHYPRKCWYVKDEVLARYQLESLPVPTDWVYLTKLGQRKVDETESNRLTSTTKSEGSVGSSITKFVVKTTSEDLFTSPSAASPKPRAREPGSASTPTNSGSPLSGVAASVAGTPCSAVRVPSKPTRRLQLTTLSGFIAKPSNQANPTALSAAESPNAIDSVRNPANALSRPSTSVATKPAINTDPSLNATTSEPFVIVLD